MVKGIIMTDNETLFIWLLLYGASGFGAFALALGLRAWRKARRPGWPVSGRWLVTMLFAAMAWRFADAAIVRWRHATVVPPHAIIQWVLIDLLLTWVAVRWARGRLLLGDPPAEGDARRRA